MGLRRRGTKFAGRYCEGHRIYGAALPRPWVRMPNSTLGAQVQLGESGLRRKSVSWITYQFCFDRPHGSLSIDPQIFFAVDGAAVGVANITAIP